MKRRGNIFVVLLFLIGCAVAGYFLFGSSDPKPAEAAHEEHGEEAGHEEAGDEEHGEGGGHEEGQAEGGKEEHGDETRITDETAASMQIETVQAGAASIRETKSLSGRIVLNQNASAQVKARFPGIVRSVVKQAGDKVKRGEKLATVESNESLQVYAVISPLDGVVLQRHISVGDAAGDEAIFEVADLTKLWVEFYVFANDAAFVQQGQPVRIRTLDDKLSSEGTIQAILPTTEAASQTVVGRAVLDNTAGTWRAGMTVRVDVVTSEQQVSLAVPSAAIQRMEGESVVFVKDGEEYRAMKVKLGAKDRDMTQIVEGIEPGVQVVSRNSFLVKADIGKAGASHEH